MPNKNTTHNAAALAVLTILLTADATARAAAVVATSAFSGAVTRLETLVAESASDHDVICASGAMCGLEEAWYTAQEESCRTQRALEAFHHTQVATVGVN